MKRHWPWLLIGCGYLVGAGLLLSTVGHPPLPLDDAALLKDFQSAGPTALFAHDRYAQLRPGKNAWFMLLARHPGQLPWLRAIVVVTCLASAWLMARLARPLLPGRPRWPWVLALLWLLNPTTISTVAWLATGNYVFALFGALAFFALSHRVRAAEPGARRWWLAAASGLALLGSALQHPIALSAGPLWVAYDACLERAPVPGRRATFAILAPVYGIVACLVIALHLRAGAPEVDPSAFVDVPERWLLSVSAARYLFENLLLGLWPFGRFGILLRDQPARQLAASGLCIALAGAAAYGLFVRGRRDPVLRFAGLWTLAWLLPVINLVPLGNTPVALRYFYLPGWGILLLCARLCLHALARLGPRAERTLAALTWAVGLAWSASSWDAAALWKSPVALYARTVDNYPDNRQALVNLAALHLERGQLPEARRLLEHALASFPDDRLAASNYVSLLVRTGDYPALLTFLRDRPWARTTPEARHGYARALAAAGQLEPALAELGALLTSPLSPELHFAVGYDRARLLVELGRHREAKRALQALLQAFPGDRDLLLTLQLIDQVLAQPAVK